MNDMLRILELCKNTEQFKKSLIIKDDLELILDAGLIALSESDNTEVKLIVASNIELIDKIIHLFSKHDNMYPPSHIVIMVSKCDHVITEPEVNALHNMRIMATSMGIATRWQKLSLNTALQNRIKKILSNAKDYVPIYLLYLGYDYHFTQSNNHFKNVQPIIWL